MTISTPPTPSAVAPDANLDRSLVRGLAWTGIAKWTTQILRWMATFAIARLLAPADYGLVGMGMVYVGFVQLFSEFGLASAIVQNHGLTKHDISRLSGIALGLGVVLFIVSVMLAPPIAAFYNEPAVKWIVIVLSTKFVVDAAAMASKAMLGRELRFKRLAWVEATDAVSMLVVTLSAAIVLRSYWALVAGLVAGSLVATAVAVASSPVRPVFTTQIKPLLGSVLFGRDVAISSLAWYAYTNADFAVVGRVLNKAALGAYSFAWNMASVPVEKVSAMVNRVAPAVFAAVQTDTAALRRYFLGVTEGLAFITFPLSIGLALVAEEFVLTAVGNQWVDAILPMRWLAVFAGFRSLVSLPQLVLVARGHTRQARNYSVAAAIVMPGVFLFASRWGLAGVAMTWIFVFPLVVLPLDFRYTFRLLEMGAGAFVRVLLPAIGGSAVMSAVVLAVRAVLPGALPVAVRLLALVAVGGVTYAAYMFAAHRERLRTYWQTLNAARRGEALQAAT